MRLWIVLGIALCAACAPAEHTRPSALPITGPDGSPTLHVSCGAEEGRCYELAGRHCPTGYDIEPTRGRSGNFLVRCRADAGARATPVRVAGDVQPWPADSLAPSPDRPAAEQYPPLTPGGAPPAAAPQPPATPAPRTPDSSDSARDLGY